MIAKASSEYATPSEYHVLRNDAHSTPPDPMEATTVICAHADAVPVESTVTGEVLAALCPECGRQLSAEFLNLSDADWAKYAELCADLMPAQDALRRLVGSLRALGHLQ